MKEHPDLTRGHFFNKLTVEHLNNLDSLISASGAGDATAFLSGVKAGIRLSQDIFSKARTLSDSAAKSLIRPGTPEATDFVPIQCNVMDCPEMSILNISNRGWCKKHMDPYAEQALVDKTGCLPPGSCL